MLGKHKPNSNKAILHLGKSSSRRDSKITIKLSITDKLTGEERVPHGWSITTYYDPGGRYILIKSFMFIQHSKPKIQLNVPLLEEGKGARSGRMVLVKGSVTTRSSGLGGWILHTTYESL